MSKHKYDPLAIVPSAATIRDKIGDLQSHTRKLRVLLRTAEQIERISNSKNSGGSSAIERRLERKKGGDE